MKSIMRGITVVGGRVELPVDGIVENCTFLGAEVVEVGNPSPTLDELRARYATGDPRVTRTPHGYKWRP